MKLFISRKFSCISLLFIGVLCHGKDISCVDDSASLASRPIGLAVETSLFNLSTDLAMSEGSNYRIPNSSRARMPAYPVFASELNALASVGSSLNYGLSGFKGNQIPTRTIQRARIQEENLIDMVHSSESELRRIKRIHESQQMTLGPGIVQGIIEMWPKDIKGNAEIFKIGSNSTNSKKCTNFVLSSYQVAEDEVAVVGDYELLAKDFLENPDLFQKINGEEKSKKVETYIGAFRRLLDACYSPAEESDFVKRNSILSRVGVLMVGDRIICTGLLMGDGRYVLSARHCLINSSNSPLPASSLSNMWFRTADGGDRFQVCAVVGSNVLDRNMAYTTRSDQALLRISPGLPSQSKLAVFGKGKVKTLSSNPLEKDAPTLLLQFSYLPLAKNLDKTRFSSGIVETSSKYCAVVVTDTGCFVNTCSGLKGGSGAALFVSQPGPLTLAGTFIGRGATQASDCTSERASSYNTASYVNEALVAPFVEN